MNPGLLIRRCLFLLCMVIGLHGTKAHAQQVSDAQLKAALIYNFMVFVEWPEGERKKHVALNICLPSSEELYGAVQILRDKQVRGQGIAVTLYRGMNDATHCHVLYIDESFRAQWPSMRKRLAGQSLLTIADPDARDIEGVVINLVNTDNRIGFEVDSIAARNADLLISSKLLRLARKVH